MDYFVLWIQAQKERMPLVDLRSSSTVEVLQDSLLYWNLAAFQRRRRNVPFERFIWSVWTKRNAQVWASRARYLRNEKCWWARWSTMEYRHLVMFGGERFREAPGRENRVRRILCERIPHYGRCSWCSKLFILNSLWLNRIDLFIGSSRVAIKCTCQFVRNNWLRRQKS